MDEKRKTDVNSQDSGRGNAWFRPGTFPAARRRMGITPAVWILLGVLFLFAAACGNRAVHAAEEVYIARPSVDGRLHVEGTSLANEAGQAVALRGVSTHGLTWFPSFLAQDLCLRTVSTNTTSTKWSGIYETSVMPLMLIPIVKEALRISLSVFKVTDKTLDGARRRTTDWKAMAPFFVLIALTAAGIVRICFLFGGWGSVGLVILLYWMIRNLYFLLMSVFLINGRDRDGELVHVYDAETVTVWKEKGKEDACLEDITTHLTDTHSAFSWMTRMCCISGITSVPGSGRRTTRRRFPA